MEDLLIKRYEVEAELLQLEEQEKSCSQVLRQAKYDLRQAEEDKLLYEGSLRSFLDKFSGKQAERLEALTREVSHRKAALADAQQQKERLTQKRAALEAEEKELPPFTAFDNPEDPEIRLRWAALEQSFCIKALLPLLEKTGEALLEYRKTLQGNRPGEILTQEQIQWIYKEPEIRAEKCRPYLDRLEKAGKVLGQEPEPGAYLQSPESYLVSPAAIHNRRDRVNQAIDQIYGLRNRLASMERLD